MAVLRSRHLPILLALALAACGPDGDAPAAGGDTPSFRGNAEPVDEGVRHDGFVAMRDSLLGAVARRDTAAVLGWIGPDARLSFESDATGPDGFRAMWFGGDPPGGRDPWRVLGAVLGGGSIEEDGAVTVPFVYGIWPEELDPTTHVAVPGTRVAARAAAAPDAPVVARLTQIALATTGPPENGWRPVRLPDGAAAWVAVEDALSPSGYRASFWPDADGAWRLRTLLTDDEPLPDDADAESDAEAGAGAGDAAGA